MKAILSTRCGCTREMSVTDPPRSYIDIPLRTTFEVQINVKTPISIKKRTFKLEQIVHSRFVNDYAEYKEIE